MEVVLPTLPRDSDAVLVDAFRRFGCPRPGGASESGWSKIADYLRCPYRYCLKHDQRVYIPAVTGQSLTALDTGSYTHALLAARYARMLPEGYPGHSAKMPEPHELLEALRACGGSTAALQQTEQLFEGYVEYYGGEETLTPVAVEFIAGKENVHTSRYDLVSYVDDSLYDGLWIIEHKTASANTDLELWRHDGEVLGEVYSWKLSNLDAVFDAPLRGVCINVLMKGARPAYRRLWLRFEPEMIAEFEQHRRHYETMIDYYHRIGYWPKSYFGCSARYGRCSFWEHCSTLDPNVLIQRA